MDSKYWNNFYQSNPDLSNPSAFAEYVVSYLKKNNIHINLFDAGSGNGRDTNFIAHNQINILGLDQSDLVITENLKHVNQNMNNFLNYLPADFTTFNYDEEKLLLNNIMSLKKLLYLFIEARTVEDSIYGDGRKVGEHEFVTSHYRRFIEPLDLIKKIKNCGFEIAEFVEGVNFSKTDHENPHLVRIIAKKK